MNLCFFGSLGDRIGRELHVDLDPATRTIGDLRRELARRFAECAPDLLSPSVRASVDDEIVDDCHVITDVGRVEFFPPLSGG
jgi:molybdopterin converting factor small subunit